MVGSDTRFVLFERHGYILHIGLSRIPRSFSYVSEETWLPGQQHLHSSLSHCQLTPSFWDPHNHHFGNKKDYREFLLVTFLRSKSSNLILSNPASATMPLSKAHHELWPSIAETHQFSSSEKESWPSTRHSNLLTLNNRSQAYSLVL